MNALLSFFGYLFAPEIFVTHVIAGGLLVALSAQGTPLPRVIPIALGQEILTLLLWMIFRSGWAAILSLFVCIVAYEKITGLRLVIANNLNLLSGDDSVKNLSEKGNLIQYIHKENKGVHRLITSLRFVEYSNSYFYVGKELNDINLDLLVTLSDGWDIYIKKLLVRNSIEKEHCFNIQLSDKRSVTAIASTAEEKTQWLEAIRATFLKSQEILRAEWLEKLYNNTCSDNKTQMTLENVVNVLNNNSRKTDRAYIKEIFATFSKLSSIRGKKGEDVLDMSGFCKFYDLVSRRPEINHIFEKLLDKKICNTNLPLVNFQEFMENEQKEKVTRLKLESFIEKYDPLRSHSKSSLSSIGFTSYILSEDNSIYPNTNYDMSQPISHYWIATSHNTYLLRDQLKGKSSVEAYISAFKRGCKCVELDCWDGPNNEPIIYHGHTLTSRILFKDVIFAIKEYAFVISSYPVILSFENHCSIEQQKVMAQHLVNILGDKLLTKQLDENISVLPSPESLKNKVIVKAKKLKYTSEDLEEESDSEDESDEIESNDQQTQSQTDQTDSSVNKGAGESKALDKVLSSFKRKSTKKEENKLQVPKIAQELSDLVVMCQAVHFHNFDYSQENNKCYDMSSFSEKRAVRFSREECSSFVKYNRRQFSRIYPAGSRVDSSNYDPIPMWNVGSQLVALNYQTADRSMQLNQSLFQDNSGCGYILKPDCLRNGEKLPKLNGPYSNDDGFNLSLKIISGNHMPYSNENKLKNRNLMVSVRLSGVEADNQKLRTRTVTNNGYNPVWNETLSFRVHVPDLCFLQLQVTDQTDLVLGKEYSSFIAQACIPLRCMKQGFREVPLQNKNSEKLPYTTLLVHSVCEKLVNM